MSFKFTETELLVLKNFSAIHPSMYIKPDCIDVKSNGNSVLARHTFAEPYSFEPFGIYNVPEFLQAIGTLKNPTVEPTEKYLDISDGNSKARYFTTAKEMCPVVPIDKIEASFAKFDVGIEADVTAEKLALISKFASIFGTNFVFFETDKKGLLITVANELKASQSSYEIHITEGIVKNSLEAPVKVAVSDLRFYSGDYHLKVTQRITHWKNTGLDLFYYVGVDRTP
jgi:hypothetical protein